MGKIGKVTLDRSQAKALEELLKIWEGEDIEYTRSTLVEEHVKGGWSDCDLRAASDIPLDDFITALYVGYEVEKTPEERVQALYGEIRREFMMAELGSVDVPYYRGVRRGIELTLDALGMKIEGVND